MLKHETSLNTMVSQTSITKQKYVQFEQNLKDKTYVSCKDVMGTIDSTLNDLTNKLNGLNQKYKETFSQVKNAVPQMDHDYAKISRLEKSLKKVNILLNNAQGELNKRTSEQKQNNINF